MARRRSHDEMAGPSHQYQRDDEDEEAPYQEEEDDIYEEMDFEDPHPFLQFLRQPTSSKPLPRFINKRILSMRIIDYDFLLTVEDYDMDIAIIGDDTPWRRVFDRAYRRSSGFTQQMRHEPLCFWTLPVQLRRILLLHGGRRLVRSHGRPGDPYSGDGDQGILYLEVFDCN
ncbi:hypothetical protein L1987_43569 [Smallanthus sonchifolius]|uniref:Uncharacterized protein n=1 Tax=Smallanthus sonchifolius TaxID=185202 RepID=A0ACB9GLX3_9ASTR|nr:hypothetical protein L1987_43569 [Smallanthus sonchifolius]